MATAGNPERGRRVLARETPGVPAATAPLAAPDDDDPDPDIATDESAEGARVSGDVVPVPVRGTPASLTPARGLSAAPVPLDPVLVTTGMAIVGRSLARRLFGWKRYPGSAEAVCRAVVEDCWNGRFLAGSAGHFRQFWTRDLAMCTPALVRLGQRERVAQSWAWALERFERAGRITTTVFYGRYPRDVYDYACDSLPLLLYGLREAGLGDLVRRHRELLSREVVRFHETVCDPDTGLARSHGYFSSPRDCMTGRSTVFASTMIAALAHMLEDQPELPRPPASGAEVTRRLVARHWTGAYFTDALDREAPSGDGNVWPFLLGILGDDDGPYRRAAMATLAARGFAEPVPLRYFERRLPQSELLIPRVFTPNYQGDTSWTQLGALYLRVLRDVDRPQFERRLAAMRSFIERDGNYLELYRSDGRPYRGRAALYHADEGMLWAALFLDLLAPL